MVKTNLKETDLVFHSIFDEPIKIYGIKYEDGKFRRLPEAVAKTVSDAVYSRYTYTAGGRIRFQTNSKYVAINVNASNVLRPSYMAFSATAGFDMYVKKGEKMEFAGAFIMPDDFGDDFEGIIRFDTEENRDIVINFPCYSEICDMHIGLSDKSYLKAPTPYKNSDPIVYYGSSITQGACASRPGNTYEAIISERYNYDYINLGFGGSAMGERAIAEYIAKLPMSLFVLDYDHNAPTVEHLEQTHKPFFDVVRKENPDLPIVMVSRPEICPTLEETLAREAVIKQTYNTAVQNGDKNVYFVSGREIYLSHYSDMMTVDCVHPTDYGMSAIADVLGDVIHKILK